MEFSDLRSRMYRVGNYIKESTSKSLDGLKSDRRLGSLQDEINDAYRMLGYLFYTEMKKSDPECPDCKELYEKSAEIVSKIDKKCEEIEQVKLTGLNCYKYVFFARSGFSQEETDTVKLIGIQELYNLF